MAKDRKASQPIDEFAAEIIARIAAGESERSACRSVGIDRNRVFKLAADDNSFRALMADAKARGREVRKTNPPSFAAPHFGRFVELVAGGATYEKICRDNPEFPDPEVFRWFAAKDSGRRARLDAALNARMAGPWATAKPAQKYSEDNYDRALAAFSQRMRWKRWSDGGLGRGVPTMSTLRQRARHDPAFRLRLAEAVAKRPEHIRAAKAKVVRREGEHLRRLADCDLYTAAARIVPKSFIERDDLISQIVIGVFRCRRRPPALHRTKRLLRPPRRHSPSHCRAVDH